MVFSRTYFSAAVIAFQLYLLFSDGHGVSPRLLFSGVHGVSAVKCSRFIILFDYRHDIFYEKIFRIWHHGT